MSAATDLAAAAAAQEKTVHTISLLVHDVPGVLVRVALVFSRRGYNIESLVVSAARQPGFSRMTITSSGDAETLEQIIKQLAKLVDVVHAIDHTLDRAYETEIALIKIASAIEQRTEILQIAEHFKARLVDYGTESLIMRVSGGSEKIDAIVDVLDGFEIVEVIRSGKILMTRGIQRT